MFILYPKIKPYLRHDLKVSDVHQLYLEESGTPEGIPIVFVHGGPGAACDAISRRFFDPEKFRIVLFDQRGAGRSTPHAELEGNNTTALLEDLEVIRQFLKIDKWILFGGSWGSTLSLLYAQAHPQKVLGMILRGVFLCRRRDFDWLYQDGASRIFPDYWKDFISVIPEAERGDLIAAYHKRLTGNDELARMSAAKAWCLWEAKCSTLRPSHETIDKFTDPRTAIAMARIEAHYFVNNGFIDDRQILDNMHLLEGIPGIIVHGRYDMACPLDNALAIHELWESAELHIIRDAGHAASEPGIIDALVRATHDMAESFEDDFL